MKEYKFFAFLNRLKYIGRWSLMRSNRTENVAEHTYMTALLAHSLCLLANRRLGIAVNADKAAALALYHETAEVLTGDMPTPVKYHNEDIRTAYKHIESAAERKILASLPPDLQPDFAAYVQPDRQSAEYAYVKYADKLSAYIKCIEEEKGGNSEFSQAKKTIEAELKAFHNPAVDLFMQEFVPAFSCSLDEMTDD